MRAQGIQIRLGTQAGAQTRERDGRVPRDLGKVRAVGGQAVGTRAAAVQEKAPEGALGTRQGKAPEGAVGTSQVAGTLAEDGPARAASGGDVDPTK